MSGDLISRSDDLQRLIKEGFVLELYGNTHLIVHNVPYVNSRKRLARGKLVCTLSLLPDNSRTAPATSDHTMHFIGEVPCHINGLPLDAIINSSGAFPIVGDIVAQHYLSSKPEGSGKYENYYDKVVAYEKAVGNPARHYDRSANARSGGRLIATDDDSPFQIPDTASARYRITPLNKLFSAQAVGIVGLGGTGSYVLDLVAKTPVREVHLFDGDQLLNHNLFRSPGVPTEPEVADFPLKTDFYQRTYSRMHKGINSHPEYITDGNVDSLRGLDFVFVCVDNGNARKLITSKLAEFGIDFSDTGIGVGLVDDKLDGVVRCTTVLRDRTGWASALKYLPFGEPEEDEYDADIQIADLNSLNACFAVLRWKRLSGFYRDYRDEENCTYMIEGNSLTSRPT
jgi:hypothetical protein